MILCPFCQTAVLDYTDKKPVQDGHASHFYCPNYTGPEGGEKKCHFFRKQHATLEHGSVVYTYEAFFPPFNVVWTTNRKITVFKLEDGMERAYTEPPFYQPKGFASYNLFIKTCQRFKVLVPFI